MNRIHDLLNKLIRNTVTQQELGELKELLNDHSNYKEAERFITEQYKSPRSEKEGLTRAESYQMIENILATTRPSLKTKQSRLVMATVAIAVVAAIGIWMNSGKLSDRTNASNTSSIKTFSGKGYIHLPDGSTVLLNEGTELSYSLTDKGREVKLRGEAYFDVAHDASKPFRVVTGKVVTTVLGTAFNVNANSAQNIVVTVTRGKVAVGDEDQSYGTIIPNEQLTVNTSTKDFVRSQVDSRKAVAWKADYLIIDNITLAAAASLIEERFKVKVTILNPKLRDCVVTGLFSGDESLQQIVEGISAVQQATAIIKGDSVTIEGGIGCSPSH